MNKQIQEMAVLGCKRNPQAYTADECEKCIFKYGSCNAYSHAEALYNAGYRKIPEDSVVLTREEYEMHITQYKNLEIKYSNLSDNYRLCKDANETLKQNVIIARKETAEKILQMFEVWEDKPYVSKEDFKRSIADLFGVEIKE